MSLPHLLNSTCPLSIYVRTFRSPGGPALCTNVKYIHQDQVYGVNIPYIFSKSGTHGWLTDALPYSLRGNGDLEKLRETGRECCASVSGQPSRPVIPEKREAHLPTVTQQQRLASEIDKFDFRKPATLLKLKLSMTFLACNQAHTRGGLDSS